MFLCASDYRALFTKMFSHENNGFKYLLFHLCKDFLRNIPGSIFSSDLYGHWVCVMDQGNDEEKINTIQRYLFYLKNTFKILTFYMLVYYRFAAGFVPNLLNMKYLSCIHSVYFYLIGAEIHWPTS
jgi:hypothetical protein